MFTHLSVPLLLLFFALAAVAVWVAGVHLSNAVDILSTRFGLGEALAGLILLSIVTNLPELAITVSASLHHDLGIAIGNILGGIALQTVVLVILDVFGLGKANSLMYRSASLILVLEAVLVIVVLTLTVIGHEMPESVIFARTTPAGLLIVLFWLLGLYLIGKARTDLPWHEGGDAPDSQKEEQGHSEKRKEQDARNKNISTGQTVLVFVAGAAVTLVAGVVLEATGNQLAVHIGMTGVLFGATILAAATALPEVSTGLTAVKMGDYQLAVSDIFGGNAFLPVLFLVATLLSGQAVLPQAQKTDIYLTGLGILLTAIYIYGLIFRPRRQFAHMGLNSLAVLLFYILGIIGLFAIAR